jgi:ankyrin repeat protein
VFRYACARGHLSIAQWLFQIAQERGFHIMDNINNDRLGVLLYQICEDGHLDMLKWLYHIKQDIPISVSELWQSCRYGHLDMVQWIIQVKPNINISEKNEQAFRYACGRGHLDVAKWLLQVKPDINISANNECAFSFACSNMKLRVMQWLQQMKPYLYVIEYDEDGNYKGCKIRNKKDANWEQRKYLVWLASDHCPEINKNNLLYKLPSDVSRLLIGFV